MTAVAVYFIRLAGALGCVCLGMLAVYGLVWLVWMVSEPRRGR